MISLIPVSGIPEVRPGDDLGRQIADGLAADGIGLTDDDVVVVTQKVVS
jgi:coenzyme F420-0:L-glutamate ligase/coenzyme F420-1:gamma-L-glutamate ligase